MINLITDLHLMHVQPASFVEIQRFDSDPAKVIRRNAARDTVYWFMTGKNPKSVWGH